MPFTRRSVCTGALSLGLGGCRVLPQPIDPQTHGQSLQKALDAVLADEEPVKGAIGLYEAMARSIKYNLDHHIEVLDEILRARELDLKGYDQLPQLVASTTASMRSNDPGGRSRSLLTGLESAEGSTSTEKRSLTGDLTLSWDVLDFGLSYVRARQGADETLIAQERRRKVINRIIEDEIGRAHV